MSFRVTYVLDDSRDFLTLACTEIIHIVFVFLSTI